MDQPQPSEAAPAVEAPAAKQAHPYRAFAIRAGLGAAVVAALLWHFDARPALSALAHEDLRYFGAAVALYVAGQVMSAYRWRLLAAVLNLRATFKEFLAYYFVGMFTNLFVPGLVGGDTARAIYLGRRCERMGPAVASVLADRGVGLLALFWVAATAALLLNFAPLPSSIVTPTVLVGVVTLIGFVAAPILMRVVPVLPARLRSMAEVVEPYLRRPATMAPAIALSIVLQISMAVCQYLLALGLGLSAPLSLFVLCVPIANVFSSLPLTLNGLGLRESAYLVLFGMAGMPKEEAIALGLLWFATTLLGGLTGAIAFAATPATVETSAAKPN